MKNLIIYAALPYLNKLIIIKFGNNQDDIQKVNKIMKNNWVWYYFTVFYSTLLYSTQVKLNENDCKLI